MSVQVLFFGATADIVGTRNIIIEVGPETTADVVLKNISERFPAISAYKLKISVNQQYATGDQTIRDTDELAIFTAVSGG